MQLCIFSWNLLLKPYGLLFKLSDSMVVLEKLFTEVIVVIKDSESPCPGGICYSHIGMKDGLSNP